MSQRAENFEQVSIYQLSDESLQRLMMLQRECVFNWCTRDEWPVGVIMSYIWRKDRIWLTAAAHRHRISAIRRNPKVSVVVTSTGTEMNRGKTVTIKGHCQLHEDKETKDWFYPEFSRALYPELEAANAFQQLLDSPLRVIIEVIPDKFISYDGDKKAAHAAGTLDPAELSSPLESDTLRLKQELRRRKRSD